MDRLQISTMMHSSYSCRKGKIVVLFVMRYCDSVRAVLLVVVRAVML